MNDIRASVIITAFNEGVDLEVTTTLAAFGSIRPAEIIIVDDCSREPITPQSRPHLHGSIYRTPSQIGVAASRTFGAQKATGDLLIFLDGHMRMPHYWLESIIDAHRKFPRAILCPSCASFQTGWTTAFHAAGATFAEQPDPDVGLMPYWKALGDPKVIDTIPCVMGACYAIPVDLWHDLSGLNPNLFGWGGDEEDMSIRAWQMGYECRRINGLTVSHKWDRELTVKAPYTWPPGFNQVVNCATLFEDGVFEKSFEPFLRQRYPEPQVWHRFDQELNFIRLFRQYVQSRRIISDLEIEKAIGLHIPTPDEQQAILDRRRTARKAS